MDFPSYLLHSVCSLYTVKFPSVVNFILYTNITLLVKERKNSEIQVTLKFYPLFLVHNYHDTLSMTLITYAHGQTNRQIGPET